MFIFWDVHQFLIQCLILLIHDCYLFLGDMFLLNTIESFKQLDKSEWLKKQGEKAWDTIQTGKFWQNPETLCSFSVIIYADLKKFHFYYWLNFPSFSIRNDVKVVSSVKISDSPMAGTCDSLSTASVEYRKANQNSLFTLVKFENDKWTFHPFSDLKELTKDELCKAEYFVGLFDPCSATEYPSWTLRNMIVALTSTRPDLLANIKFLSIRMVIKEGTYDVSESLITKLECDDTIDSTMPNVVGWEKNEKGQLGPRFVNMRSSMDPVKIAESSVDLNLKLMKWRLVPDLNLDAVANAKFLLLGAGTLGCGVARCLLGWGARNITFLDNAKVSYSNPVRQSLYEFKDCLDGGKKKSVAAAEKLKEIFPGVVSNSYEMTIPMPGHPIAQSLEPEAKSAYDTLKTLIDESDVIFLLMDSRESRWLPTVMTAAHPEKILINAALGFDTYLVMRHGVRHEGHVTNPSHQLTAESLSGKGNIKIYFFIPSPTSDWARP